MFRQFLQLLLGRKPRTAELTDDDLNRMDVAYEEGLTVFDCEGVMVEEGEVVGTTAFVNEQNQLELTGGRLPAGSSLPHRRP